MADGMTHLVQLPKGKTAAPTPLLRFLTGPHADAIATVWPAPHQSFLALPAARRHAAAILLAHGQRDLASLARRIERDRDSLIAGLILGEADRSGFMKALARMGETLWRTDDYDRFLSLFKMAAANQVMRHMGDIRPSQLVVVDTLPPALHDARIMSMVPGLQAARDLALTLCLVAKINGDGYARQLAGRLGKAKDATGLFAMAADALHAQRFATPPPVPALGAPFVAVNTRNELERVAFKFKNCLRDFLADMAKGRMAVFLWTGEPVGVLALRLDPAGWRLAEAEGHANEPLPPDALRDLVTQIEAAGIRTGPSTWSLMNRLHRHPHGDEPVIGPNWEDRLELGELWD